MKCISCGKEEFDEGDVKVEGKLYGIKIKIGKKKSGVKAIICRNCKMVFLKQEEDWYV